MEEKVFCGTSASKPILITEALAAGRRHRWKTAPGVDRRVIVKQFCGWAIVLRLSTSHRSMVVRGWRVSRISTTAVETFRKSCPNTS